MAGSLVDYERQWPPSERKDDIFQYLPHNEKTTLNFNL